MNSATTKPVTGWSPGTGSRSASKRGWTVFRDQTYYADRYGKTLSQISNARMLRGGVFPYDSGAMTHPMVLQSYVNTDNNYDVLTYPKGAAVNRMLETLVGEDAYEKAYREFFATPVVRTATIEEFFSAIAQSSGKNLDQFISTWLSQAGVPELEISTEYHETPAGIHPQDQADPPSEPGRP
jgi:aminopeptidase N